MADLVQKNIKIKLKKLQDNAVIPDKATPGSSGFDLYSTQEMSVMPLMSCVVSTGIAIELPEGYEAQIRTRSGWARNEGLMVLNSPGTIDSDYRGEIQVILYNAGQGIITIDEGSKIAQMVIAEVPQVSIEMSEDLNDTERGDNGFGSSGNSNDDRVYEGDGYSNDGKGINVKKVGRPKKETKLERGLLN